MTQPDRAWEELLSEVFDFIDDLEKRHGITVPYSLGGGTMLMRRYRHRLSRDLDVFVSDTQLLRLLSPRINETTADRFVDYQETSNALRFIVDLREIDVIAAPHLTARPWRLRRLLGRDVRVEEPAEIIAKKLYYRGRELTARDVFDVAVVATKEPAQLHDMPSLLQARGVEEVSVRLDELEPSYPRLAERIEVLPAGADLLPPAPAVVRGLVDEWRGVLSRVAEGDDRGSAPPPRPG